MVDFEEHGHSGRRAPLDIADAALVLCDAHGRVESWPEGAERLFGHPAADVVGRAAAALLAPDDADRLPELAAECRAHGGWSGTLTARRKNGAPVDVMVQLARVTDGEGAAHWLAVAAEASSLPGWEMSRAVLEKLLMQTPVGMAVVDTDLRFVWSNLALERFGGGRARDRIGRRLAEVQPGLDAEALEEQMRRVLESGEPVLGYEHIGRPQSEPHHERAHAMSFVRLDGFNGRPLGVCYTVIDITERYRNRQRLVLLDRAGTAIGQTLDVLRTAQELADVAVPDLADFVTVDLLDSVIRGGEPLTGPPGDADRVALRRGGQQSSRAGIPEAVVAVGDLASYHSWSPPIRAMADGTSWRVEWLDPHGPEWAADVPGGRRRQLREQGLHTAMVVPIRARGTTMGVTSFFRCAPGEPFGPDDQRLAEEFVARAAVCLDNARRYTRERAAALTLQRSLLPQGVADHSALSLATCYRPADELAGVGGDWFDVIPLSGARLALVVGEVRGHGISAIATMGRLRTAVQTLAALDLRPEELLARLDDLVSRVSEEGGKGAETGATGTSCLYAVYDPVGRCFTMASAGHPPPVIVAPDGTAAYAELPVGPQLGVSGLPFEAVEVAVKEGSVLALYTDGLLAGADREAGQPARERLLHALAAPGDSLDALCESVIGALVPRRQHDDVTLLLARTRGLATDRFASWELAADPAVVGRSREMAARQLAEWGLPALTFTTELVVSELVTNAIRYGSGPIRLRLILEHTLICEVCDGSSTSPYLRHPRTTDEGGRGLFLISQFTHRWGTRYTTDGKVIWAEQVLTT
ncbi:MULTISPECIES: SpoIIE family protein phosphatase [Streptomyces]|uniref:PAS domain-containing SpoIIE family protein phosphatase/ATP-binding protein n=1 Tax=Streptomyces yunnanensis TaxID=156453 RepID=A0ABY8A163_9ACTN|nr:MULTISPECIES: SpoIIE family protein phosphatase [Streptomyces]AJC53787.1 magnesium or manganese-dependent protein phosphatase [Streptomyces sp. 769]WEB38677.1 PAS domain-containing SpoIIE family protein phosphatase/ATP-binding protein [Streptomyces yunnanensis]